MILRPCTDGPISLGIMHVYGHPQNAYFTYHPELYTPYRSQTTRQGTYDTSGYLHTTTLSYLKETLVRLRYMQVYITSTTLPPVVLHLTMDRTTSHHFFCCLCFLLRSLLLPPDLNNNDTITMQTHTHIENYLRLTGPLGS